MYSVWTNCMAEKTKAGSAVLSGDSLLILGLNIPTTTQWLPQHKLKFLCGQPARVFRDVGERKATDAGGNTAAA
jgi:hypothetical protein